MGNIISVCLQKGGTGKSTTSQAIAACLGYLGKKTLLIDLDAQQNLTYSSGAEKKEKTAIDVFSGCNPEEAIVQLTHYDIIPADVYLTNIESGNVTANMLKDALTTCTSRYDYIILDTPPALGNIMKNALVASDYIIIPVEASTYCLQGIDSLMKIITSVRTSKNSRLKILGILLIKFHERSIINRDLKKSIIDFSKEIGTEVFQTFIRESVAVKESQSCRKDLIDYAPNSNPAIDYKNLTLEILERIEK